MQEKTRPPRLEFFLLLSPHDRARSVLTYRAMRSVADGVFSTGGFHRFLATKPVRSKPTKRNVVQFGDHGSIRDSWPIAFSGYPRGPRVGCETVCPRHTAPNLPAETRSRTRTSREPHGQRQRNPQRWSGLDPRHSSCLWFQMLGVEAYSSLPHDQYDGGNFPGQGQAGHLRPHALGQ